MHSKAKNYVLIFWLFVFLFVIIGGGLHLNPSDRRGYLGWSSWV